MCGGECLEPSVVLEGGGTEEGRCPMVRESVGLVSAKVWTKAGGSILGMAP